ncbi:MAG: DNA-3-methyladenine glycosylase I [Rhodospirillales bacterium]|nr:DNA-3-methyladenine glycosylase I [Rhodospirillales bacterium]
MVPFETVFEAAATRAGGAAALEARLPAPKSAAELRAIGDDRYLSLMSLRVFRAGLKHSLVDAKWPAFEDAFMGFEPKRVHAMSDEAMEALLGDKRLIRHGPKMRAVMRNAAAVRALVADTGGFGTYLAVWPATEIVGLWDDIAKRFTQMGGRSAPVFLRMVGKDTFLLTDDVARALVHWGAIEEAPTGKAARALVQAAFNCWAEESARPLSQISMALAFSVG